MAAGSIARPIAVERWPVSVSWHFAQACGPTYVASFWFGRQGVAASRSRPSLMPGPWALDFSGPKVPSAAANAAAKRMMTGVSCLPQRLTPEDASLLIPLHARQPNIPLNNTSNLISENDPSNRGEMGRRESGCFNSETARPLSQF